MTSISIHGSNNDSKVILDSGNASITSDVNRPNPNAIVLNPNTIVLNPRLPKLVKLLAEDSTALLSYLSNPFIKYSTFNMSNLYAEGAFYQVGLLAWLNKEISTYTGPFCPGISNVEMVAQKVIEIKDTPAAPANPDMGLNGKNGAIQVVPFNPTWNVLDTNFQNAFTILESILCFEENLGVHHSGLVSNSTLKTVGSNRVLHLDFNADVYKQFFPGGSFMLQPEVLKAVATNPDNSNVLLPTHAEASQMIANMDSELDKSFAKMQFGIKVSDLYGNFGPVNDVLGTIIKSLARGHLAIATLARKIRENPNLHLEDMSGNSGGNFLFKTGWIPQFYYMDPMLADTNHFAQGTGNYAGSGGIMPAMSSQYTTAMTTDAYEKLKSIYGIEKTDISGGTVKPPEDADGFTLTVPTTNMNENLSNALNTLPSNIPVGNTLVK